MLPLWGRVALPATVARVFPVFPGAVVGGSHFHHGYGTTGVVATGPGDSAPTTFAITTGDPSTTVTVDVSATTTFGEPGQSSPGLGGIMVGDQVVVFGADDGTDTTIDATSVEVPPARDTGTVLTTSPSFTITTGDPSTTVTVDRAANITYREPGFSSPGLANIMVGDHVLVSGTQDGAGTVTATSVYLPPGMDAGTVLTTSPSFTITTGDPSTTVTVTPAANITYREPGFSSPGVDNIDIGDRVIVFGTQEGADAVTATSIDLPRATEFGTVAASPAPTSTTFTITTAGQTSATIAVTVSGTTAYRDPGVSSPTVADVVASAHVLVVGTQNGGSSVNATSVFILPAGLGQGFFGGHGGGFTF